MDFTTEQFQAGRINSTEITAYYPVKSPVALTGVVRPAQNLDELVEYKVDVSKFPSERKYHIRALRKNVNGQFEVYKRYRRFGRGRAHRKGIAVLKDLERLYRPGVV